MEDRLSFLNERCKRLTFAVLHALLNVTKAHFAVSWEFLTCSLTLNDMMSRTSGMMFPAFFSPIARVRFRASLDKNCKKSIESSSESPRPFSFDYKASGSHSLSPLYYVDGSAVGYPYITVNIIRVDGVASFRCSERNSGCHDSPNIRATKVQPSFSRPSV